MTPDLVLDVAPTAELVTLAQARSHLRLDGVTDFDELIAAHIATALGRLDGYSGVLGRALAEQSWILHLDGFPSGAIRLPLPPLISVDEVAYVDPDGVGQTLDRSAYQVLEGERAELRPAFDATWPSTRATPRAVTISFTCGWAAPTGGATWPDKLQPAISAIKLMVEDLFAGPDDRRQAAIKALLDPLRVPRVGWAS